VGYILLNSTVLILFSNIFNNYKYGNSIEPKYFAPGLGFWVPVLSTGTLHFAATSRFWVPVLSTGTLHFATTSDFGFQYLVPVTAKYFATPTAKYWSKYLSGVPPHI